MQNRALMPFKLLITVFMLCQIWNLISQPVTFTNQSELLQPVSGIGVYADCAVDMNGDHLDDVVRIGENGIYIDFQQTDGTFSQQFYSMPIQTPPSWTICAGDLDNNGYHDLLLADQNTVSFVIANDNGSLYHEILMPGFIFSQRSTLADINNDGWLDGFVCNDLAQAIPYRNNGNGNMIPDTNLIHTSNRPGAYAAIWTDYDNDHDIDLYITKCQDGAPPGAINRTNLLYKNNGDGTFSEVAEQAGLDDNAQSWSTSFEDFDNDGDFDAFIVNHDFQNRLFRNNNDGTFTDVILVSGIDPVDLGAWENASGDFNNDGFMDIFSELNRELYLGNGNLTFEGIDAPVKPGAIADLNNDGFLDVLKGDQLWINEGNSNHWLKIIPFGITSNRDGIGARLEIYGLWGKQIREVRAGQSYSPMSSLTIHFGLGPYENVDSLKIFWPSGLTTKLFNLEADSTYIVPEVPCVLATQSIIVDGSTSICPGDSTILIAPSGYSFYHWSGKSTGETFTAHEEGKFFVICIDSNGCATITKPIEITYIHDLKPKVYSFSGNVICQGDTIELISSPEENYVWSNGTEDTQFLSVFDSGYYTVATEAQCLIGSVVSDSFKVEVLTSLPPITADVIVLPGDSILLTAEGENCHWYDQASGGNLLATGASFQTMPLTHSTTYYVESHYLYPGEFQQGGKSDTTGAGGFPSQSGYLLFEAWNPFTLDSVTVFKPANASPDSVEIQLWSPDSMVNFKQFDVKAGSNILDLNFNVPVGNFSLRCPQANLWRNRGTLEYPYKIGDAGQITSSSFGDHYYYYFYDWRIKKNDYECVSERIPVDVILSGTGLGENHNVFSIFPNPSSGIFNIYLDQISSGAIFSEILNADGREVFRQKWDHALSFQCDIEKLPPGFYILQIKGDRFFEAKKILKL
jgi:hypothetical protein